MDLIRPTSGEPTAIPAADHAPKRDVPLAITGSLVFAGLGGAATHALIGKASDAKVPGRGARIAAVAGAAFCGVVALFSALRAEPIDPPTKVDAPEHNGTVVEPVVSKQL